jgi:hypothetical protein
VIVTGGSLPRNYQWYFEETPIEGATGSSLLLTNVQAANTGRYYVVVSNSSGSITSAVAQLSLGTKPDLVDEPTNQVVQAGELLVLSAGVAGAAPMTFQWWHDGNPIYGATNATYTNYHAQWSDAGLYWLTATNPLGVATSEVIGVSILSPPAILAQPIAAKVLPGEEGIFSVQNAGSPPFAYQWYWNGAILPGATASNLTVLNVQSNLLGNYCVVITNDFGAVTSAVVVLDFAKTPLGTFRIRVLQSSNARFIDPRSVVQYPRGGIVASHDFLFYSGGSTAARYSLNDLSGGTSMGRFYDGLVSDLKTETLYSFGTGGAPLQFTNPGARMDALIELDATSLQPVGRSITLSQPLTNSYYSLLCSGYGRVVYWDFDTRLAYNIDLPSGQVSTYGPVSLDYQFAGV